VDYAYVGRRITWSGEWVDVYGTWYVNEQATWYEYEYEYSNWHLNVYVGVCQPSTCPGQSQSGHREHLSDNDCFGEIDGDWCRAAGGDEHRRRRGSELDARNRRRASELKAWQCFNCADCCARWGGEGETMVGGTRPEPIRETSQFAMSGTNLWRPREFYQMPFSNVCGRIWSGANSNDSGEFEGRGQDEQRGETTRW